jgi:glycosyltransferase involved in cell wall biosynthesis
MGGGTRLKVLEALAMRRPIVTTSLGCEGIDVADGDSVLIADEPQAFADATIRLLRDAALRRALVRRGRDLVRSQYDWSVIGGHLEEAYRQIVRPAAAGKVA